MSAGDGKTTPPLAGENGVDDDDRTRIGEPMPQAPAVEPDDDKTQFAPVPAAKSVDPVASEDADDDRTQFVSAPPPAVEDVAEDEDRTQFVSSEPEPAAETPEVEEDEERTQFAEAPQPTPDAPAPEALAAEPAPESAAEGAVEDEDRTQFVSSDPVPAAEASAPEEDEERTQFAEAQQPTLDAPAPEAPTAEPEPAPAAEAPAPVAPVVPSKDGGPTVQIGTLINNNYEVKEVLKAGGMGEVYRGENVFTGDPVAIKVVLPELAEDEKAGLLFMREARTLSQLSDDAIVRYYNFVKDPEIDRYCLIMEFIQGVPLSDYTAQNGPVPTPAVEVLMRRMAKGLEKAHTRDVIHRDLSPDNVMLPDGIVAEALLIDFGIAKSNVVKESTMAGQFAGKFKYVSPEQLGHFGGEIGPASDIYSLALLISAALLGKPLDMGGSIVEAVQARQAIPDMSEIDETLRPLLSYMLEPDPADRPENMAEVARLVDYPEEIPYKYRAGLPPLPPRHTTTATGALAGTSPGLAMPPATVSGLQTPPTTQSNIQGTSPPTSLPPQDMPKKRSGALGLVATLALAVLAGGGYYAWTEGLIGPMQTDGTDNDEIASPEGTTLPEIQPNTREGFLAAFDTGACSYASRVPAGPNAGMVQGFAAQGGVFTGLPTAYEEQFGARPSILESQITAEQCAVLELTKGLQGRGLDPISIQVEAGEVESGDPIGGQITDPLGRNVWLVLVSPKGGVYNLTGRLSEAVGDRRSFRFGLSLAEGAEAAPQLLLAIATPTPLVNAAQARDGAQAEVLLPLIAQEIADKGGQGVASLAHILLVPDVPDGPGPDDDPGDDENDG